MTNQEKLEKQKAASPIVFVLVAISAISIIVALLNSAINTPLVRSFDDAAKKSKALACESRAANEGGDPKDCWK